jgi:hypothetical protein
MAKRIKLNAGDTFSIEVAENNFIFGKIVFVTKEQYINKVSEKDRKSGLDWFTNCVLIETYIGVFNSLDKVDFNKTAVKGNFVSKSMFKRDDVKILENKSVNPQNIVFPEYIRAEGMKYYFSVGELQFPIEITAQERDEIHVYPTFGSGYWEMIATLVFSGEEKFVEDKKDIKDKSFYFTSEDLHMKPKHREWIYKMIKENSTQSYYNLALKYGYDLKRLYE